MCFLWYSDKKTTELYQKKVVMLQPYQKYFVSLWR